MRLVVFDNNFAVGNSVSGATRRQFLTQRWALLTPTPEFFNLTLGFFTSKRGKFAQY
jgi:hypothetical protein